MRHNRIARTALATLSLAVTADCADVNREGMRTAANAADSLGALAVATSENSAVRESATPAHTLRVYVSAVNCEMNQADARRLNTISLQAKEHGLIVEVVFTGIQSDTSRVLTQAARDLGLDVPVRAIRSNELKAFESIGGAHLPMVLVTKARQLKTMIAGETMPRTLSVVEASMSPAGPS